MDTVTYPDSRVAEEMSQNWVDTHIDVVDVPGLAQLFAVHAIPTAVAVRADGVVIDRVEGFAAPSDFLARLQGLRTKRD